MSIAFRRHIQWIYGGGFEVGGPSAYASILLGLPPCLTVVSGSFDGGKVVERSLKLKEPIIYVSVNYR